MGTAYIPKRRVTMICYVYDGSFEGLLNCIYEGFYSSKKPEIIIRKERYQPNLLYEVINIRTKQENSSKVFTAIKNKIGNKAATNVYYAYLSEIQGSEINIFLYLQLGFKVGADVDLHLYNESVLSICNIYKKVNYEALRMKGFLRFKEISNEVYYASFEPEHNILELILPHFCERFKNQNFVIHDVKRKKAGLYNKKQCIISYLSKESYDILNNSQNDDFYQNLWKDYYASTTIKERINPKLQKNHMPRKYWDHIIEVKEPTL